MNFMLLYTPVPARTLKFVHVSIHLHLLQLCNLYSFLLETNNMYSQFNSFIEISSIHGASSKTKSNLTLR